MIKSLLIFIFTLVTSFHVYADNLQQGITAFDNKDFNAAYRILKPLAEQGNARAQARLGFIYLSHSYKVKELNERYKGKKVSRFDITYTTAHKWLRLAATQKDSEAAFWLGYLLYAESMDAEAVPFFEIAAANGKIFAKNYLAELYMHHSKPAKKKQPEEAARLLLSLSENIDQIDYNYYLHTLDDFSNKSSMLKSILDTMNSIAGDLNDIAHDHLEGNSIIQDYKKAVKLFRLGAKLGRPLCAYNMGAMYSTGKGVLQDPISAHMWFNIAAARGVKDGAVNRNDIEKRLSKDELSEAQAMARKWMRQNDLSHLE